MLQPSVGLHAVAAREGLVCPTYTLRSSPNTTVLIDPFQTAFHSCECRSPWVTASLKNEHVAATNCILQPQLHPFTNALLPVPFVSAAYDTEHLSLSLSIFFFPVFLGAVVVLLLTMQSIYQHFGTGTHTHASRIPGVLTDVLGSPVVSRHKTCDVSSGTRLVTTANPITLVVVRLDALGPDGQRKGAREAGLGQEFDDACEVMLPVSIAVFTWHLRSMHTCIIYAGVSYLKSTRISLLGEYHG